MSQFYVGVSAGALPPSVPTTFHTDDGANVVPLANVLNVAGGTGATTTGNVGTGTVTVNVVTDGMPWLDEAVTFNAAVQTGYFCTGTITANLPATAGLLNGATIIIYVDSASVVTIQANTGQTIQIGNSQSTVGGVGLATAVSTAEGSTVTLVFRIADSEWHSISDQGTWTLA